MALVIGIPHVDVGEESRKMEIDNNTVLKHPSMQETEPEPEPTSPPKLHIVGDLEGKE